MTPGSACSDQECELVERGLLGRSLAPAERHFPRPADLPRLPAPTSTSTDRASPRRPSSTRNARAARPRGRGRRRDRGGRRRSARNRARRPGRSSPDRCPGPCRARSSTSELDDQRLHHAIRRVVARRHPCHLEAILARVDESAAPWPARRGCVRDHRARRRRPSARRSSRGPRTTSSATASRPASPTTIEVTGFAPLRKTTNTEPLGPERQEDVRARRPALRTPARARCVPSPATRARAAGP